ncbi:MAG: hypothetical protein ACPGUF_04220, partial [Litorivicinus sp.]
TPRNHPGARASGRQATFSTDILYDTLKRYDPDHLLLSITREEAMRGLIDFGRIEDMLTRLNVLSESFSTELEKVGGISQDVNESVNLAVQSMQVDDIVSQLLMQAHRALESQDQIISEFMPVLVQASNGELGVNEIRTMAQEIRTRSDQETRQAVPQGTLDEGEIELF